MINKINFYQHGFVCFLVCSAVAIMIIFWPKNMLPFGAAKRFHLILVSAARRDSWIDTRVFFSTLDLESRFPFHIQCTVPIILISTPTIAYISKMNGPIFMRFVAYERKSCLLQPKCAFQLDPKLPSLCNRQFKKPFQKNFFVSKYFSTKLV